jgi:hypothetical protein
MKSTAPFQWRLMSSGMTHVLMLGSCLILSGTSADASASRDVQLTYGLRDNTAFGRAMLDQLQRSGEQMNGRLCIALTKGSALRTRPAVCPTDKDKAQAVLHAVVLRDGDIWRIFSTHPKLLETPVSLGSISKAVLGVPLLAHVHARSDERWCPQAFGGFRNADGSTGVVDCHGGHSELPATLAMAKSNNLATIWRLRQLPAQATREQLRPLGVANVPADYHPGVAVALGVVEVSPRQTLECFDALVSGNPRRAAMVQRATAKPSGYASWCAEAAGDPVGGQFVHTMLSAPADVGGTARFLRSALPGSDNLYAKTGTPANAQRLDTGKALVGSYSRQGHRYTFLVALLSSRTDSPLAQHLDAIDLRGFVDVINQHSLNAHPPKVSTSIQIVQKVIP